MRFLQLITEKDPHALVLPLKLPMKTNRSKPAVKTHEGGTAQQVSAELELRRTLMTCLLFENTFYEGSESIAKRLADLVP